MNALSCGVVRELLVLSLIGCGDNNVLEPVQPSDGPSTDTPADDDAPLDSPPDTPSGPLADLRFVTGPMDSSILFMPGTFTANSCEMQEQCTGAAGTRQLLRFDTITENAGTADLIVGAPPAQGISDATFTWSPCHGHHHFNGYAIYELVDNNNVVVSGRKQAFCILDTIQREVGKPSNGYNCSNQGLTAGWADVYQRTLPCQWIDITGLPSGAYTLRVTVNPDHLLPESDLTNNVYEKSVTF